MALVRDHDARAEVSGLLLLIEAGHLFKKFTQRRVGRQGHTRNRNTLSRVDVNHCRRGRRNRHRIRPWRLLHGAGINRPRTERANWNAGARVSARWQAQPIWA